MEPLNALCLGAVAQLYDFDGLKANACHVHTITKATTGQNLIQKLKYIYIYIPYTCFSIWSLT